MTDNMTQHEAVRRAWLAAGRAEAAADHAATAEFAEGLAAVARAWAAVAGQLPFVEPGVAYVAPDGSERTAVIVPRPLERTEPTNTQTAAEIDREQAAADAALRGEPVPDPRPASTAVPRPGSADDRNTATCMCGLGLNFDLGYGWVHVNGGVTCPS